MEVCPLQERISESVVSLNTKTQTQKTLKNKKPLQHIFLITDFLSSLFDKVFYTFKVFKYLLVLCKHY